jgi:hypothetical protein
MFFMLSENRFEHVLIYQVGEERRELALIHIPGVEPVLASGSFPGGDPEGGRIDVFSVEEARERLDFLLRLRDAGLL